MSIYFLNFFIPFFFYLISFRDGNRFKLFFYYFYSIFLVIFIGLRYEVGGDWVPYEYQNFLIGNKSLVDALAYFKWDLYFYTILDWTGAKFSLNVFFVNTLAAIIFVWGLFSFCSKQTNPYIAYIIATPYLINIASTGYTRQAFALGFILLIISKNNIFIKNLFLLFLATLSHPTSMINFFALFPRKIFRYKNLTLIAFITLIVGIVFYDEAYLYLQYYLMQGFYFSPGAYPRYLLNLIPSIILLIFFYKFVQLPNYNYWITVAIINVAFIIPVFFIPNSTPAIDRVGIYFIPIQMLIFSNINYLIDKRNYQIYMNFLIVLLYLLILVVWLFHANHINFWIPYKLLLN